MKEFYLTAEGEERLRKELEKLKGPVREEIAKRLHAAVELGDLSENADYITTKEEQGFIEGRIQELEMILKNKIIIDEMEISTDEVGIGNRVTIQEENSEPETYHLVGSQEADPRKMVISHESPIGKALIGHHEGDKITAEIPAGTIIFKILKIE